MVKILFIKKRIALLIAIDRVGSLNAAAKLVPLSYKGAWDMIDTMNNLCPLPVVEKVTGGLNGGGTKLTEYGKNLVKTYEIIEEEHQKFLNTISHITDFDSGNLKLFRRFNMQISAKSTCRYCRTDRKWKSQCFYLHQIKKWLHNGKCYHKWSS